MLRHLEIHQRDDGMYDVVTGDDVAGPFPSMAFAQMIAEGREPARVPRPPRLMILREVLHIVRT